VDRWAPIELDEASILFVDDDLIAIDKQPGVLCDASIDPNRPHLGTALRSWANNEDAEFLPAHRLDLGTSGVVLFARNKSTATTLMQQFQERTVTKQYQAVVMTPPNEPWSVGDGIHRRSYLRHRKGLTEEVRSGGKPAESDFEVADIDGPAALVRAYPKTGRTHQLRVHLAALGAPILGDDRYGSTPPPAMRAAATERMWLHADSLEVTHPISHQPLVIQSRIRLTVANGTGHENRIS